MSPAPGGTAGTAGPAGSAEPGPGLFGPLAAELAARLGGPPPRVLYLSRNDLEPGRALEAAWPGSRVTARTKADFQGQGLGAILKSLRGEPVDLFLLQDRPPLVTRLEDLYRLAAIGMRARRRFLLSMDLARGEPTGEWRLTEVHPVRDLPGLLVRLAVEAVVSGWFLATTPAGLDMRPAEKKRVTLPGRGPYRITYLKTDYAFGVTAGGSVSHTSGVVGGLQAAGHEVSFLASDAVSDLDLRRTPVTLVPPGRTVRILEEPAIVAYHHRFVAAGRRRLAAARPDVLYQRHSLLNAAGAVLSRQFQVPLILEANNSEVWAREAWSRLHLKELATRMERCAFAGADVLVAVSKIGAESLARAGADPEKILVNPNGVDPERFRPDLDGRALRRELGFGPDDLVCGFLGTFTRWHGVLFLADQVPALAAAHPRVRFLFMGDGDLRSAVEERIRRAGAGHAAVFTGLIPHDAVPPHLAACDILVSPHLPFEDGTPFFGSPTKLFEYMAMGKPVVASALGQIRDVLGDGKSGMLYAPGSAEEFRARMDRVLGEPGLRRELGENARRLVVSDYTWRRNAERAITFLEERLDRRRHDRAPAGVGPS